MLPVAMTPVRQQYILFVFPNQYRKQLVFIVHLAK